jgi:hypothetical protein
LIALCIIETADGNPATTGKLRGLEGFFVTDYKGEAIPVTGCEGP